MTITFIAEGALSDYVDTSGLQAAVAFAAGVSVSDVSISVRAASVAITAVISVPSIMAAATVSSGLASSMGTAASASAALGLTVLSEPVIVASNPQSSTNPPSSSSSSFPMAAAAGGGAGSVLVLGLAIVLYWHRRKRASSKLHPLGIVPTPASSSTEASWFSSSTVSAFHAPAKTSRAAALLKAWELELADLIVGDDPANVIGEGGQAVVRRGKWKYLRANAFFHGYAVEDDRPKVEELYDLDADLGERNNLAGKHPKILAELRALTSELEAKK